MICERVKEQMAEYLSGALEGEPREKFVEHLEQCERCRGEVEELGGLWRSLEFVLTPEPRPAMRDRFEDMLQGYRAGLAEVRTPAAGRRAPGKTGMAWWQMAAAAAVFVVIGVAAGRFSFSQKSSGEVAQLHGEVENMRQLVTLSLLQQQSAASRLRGVTYSYQMDRPDPAVENALLFAVSHDSNVNVRLSAVDALQKYAHSASVGKALVEAIAPQDSPLVQIALIDLLVDAREGAVIPELRKLEKSDVNEAVRQRATWGLQKLGAL